MLQSTVWRVRGWFATRRTYWDRHCKNCGHEFRPGEAYLTDEERRYRFCEANGETDSSISNPRPSCLDVWNEFWAVR